MKLLGLSVYSVPYYSYKWAEAQTTNKRQCDHGQWPEASVEQQSLKGLVCLVHHMSTVPATINPEKSLLWDPDPGPFSPSRTYA